MILCAVSLHKSRNEKQTSSLTAVTTKTPAHYTWEISLLIRREGRSRRRGEEEKESKGTHFTKEKGHFEARGPQKKKKKNCPGVPFLTEYTDQNRGLKGLPALHILHLWCELKWIWIIYETLSMSVMLQTMFMQSCTVNEEVQISVSDIWIRFFTLRYQLKSTLRLLMLSSWKNRTNCWCQNT